MSGKVLTVTPSAFPLVQRSVGGEGKEVAHLATLGEATNGRV